MCSLRVIFVRHGETVFNIESRYQGHLDAELSELGRLQSQRVAERLQGEEIAAVYSSDLSRAGDTAQAIAGCHGLKVEIDESLRECAFGEWEGLSVSEIAERYPELYQNYLKDSVTYRAPEGERLESVQERVVKMVRRIEERHPDDTVVIVTHGGPIRAFFCHALGASLQTFRKVNLANCSITTFSRDSDGKWFLEVLNDSCHLEGLEAVPDSGSQPFDRDTAF